MKNLKIIKNVRTIIVNLLRDLYCPESKKNI